jgi:EpsI family protein
LAGGFRTSPSAALVTLFGGLLWLASVIVSVQVTEQLAALVIMTSLPLAVFGYRAGLLPAATIGLMGFGIPIWDYVGPLLQDMTTEVVGVCLSATTIPVLIEGNLVTIPPGRFRIAAGCSGLSYFVAAGALGAVFGLLWLERWRDRALLVGIAFALSVLANWTRVFVVILSGYLTDMQGFLVRVDHYYFGWVLFGIAMVPMYVVGTRLEHRQKQNRDNAIRNSGRRKRGALAASVVATTAAMAAAPLSWGTVGARADANLARPDLPTIVSWRLDSEATPDWTPRFIGAAELSVYRFSRDSQTVDLGIAWYPVQSQGRELIFYANDVADPSRWQAMGPDQTISVDGLSFTVREILSATSGARLVAWWYEVGGRVATSGSHAKWLQFDAFFRGRLDGGLVAVSARCDVDCDSARQRVLDFIRGLGQPALLLPEQGGGHVL